MKKTNIFTFICISFICFLLFPETSKADPIKSGTDKCINDNTCIQVCEWDNEGYHVYAYYLLDTNSWKYVWYYPYNPFRAEQVSTSLPPSKNVLYESNRMRATLNSSGACPTAAYVDIEGFSSWEPELCFDSKTIVKKDKTYCITKTGWGQKFSGSSSLIYTIDDQIERYFSNKPTDALKNTTCSSLADSTGYVVDEKKVEKLLDEVLIDYSHNFLYDYKMPDWMKNGSYKTEKENYDRKVNLKVKACNVELREKARQDLEAGTISEEQFNQIVNNGSNVEQGVQDKLDELDKDINNGNNPSSPSYKPSSPTQSVTDADCNSLLGPTITGYLKTALTIIQVAGIVLAIILGMTDFLGAVLSGEADSNKKAFKKFTVRVAVAAILFIVPALLKLVLNTFGVTEAGMCIL